MAKEPEALVIVFGMSVIPIDDMMAQESSQWPMQDLIPTAASFSFAQVFAFLPIDL